MRIAAIQLSSQDSVEQNLAAVSAVLAEARSARADVALLPENFAFFGGEDAKRAAAESIEDGPITTFVREAAVRLGMAIIAGGLPERSADPLRPFNTCLAVGPNGDILAKYRKIHLFDVTTPDGAVYAESQATSAGEEVRTVNIEGVTVGLSVCYDLRFPELYRILSAKGASVLVVPAAFTLQTGKDHWTPLLRARAIENQCYVVAAAQWGKHPGGRQTYGKSMIIEPWGDVVAQVPDGVGFTVAEIDLERIQNVRAQIPCLTHRKL